MTSVVPRIAVLDYGTSNLHSACKALEVVGGRVHVATRPDEVGAVDAVVLPGVGNFGAVMRRIRAQGLDEAVGRAVEEGTPLLGICLGMQLLLDGSEESPGEPGLGVVSGDVVRLATSEKLPDIGWREVSFRAGSALGPEPDASPAERTYYFVHSYACQPADPSVVAGTARHGVSFAATIEHGSVTATQFHPEKSSRAGLALLRRWVAGVASPVAEGVAR